MQVFQTAGVPPSSGSTILPTIGCTKNSRKALVNRVRAKRRDTTNSGPRTCHTRWPGRVFARMRLTHLRENVAMRAEDLLALLRAVPFRPFRVILNSGKGYEVRHPEFVK